MTEFVVVHFPPCARRARARLCGAAFVPPAPAQTRSASTPAMADYIVAVVNQELVTNAELQGRLARIREDAARSKTQLPPPAELRKQVLDALIDERVQVTNARESGAKVDDAELDRAVANVAVQNQMTMPQLRARLQQQGIAYSTFRNNVRDQMLVERVREREVVSRIKISDVDIDKLIEKRRAAAGTNAQIDVAQILVTVPEGANAEVVAQRQARAEAALARVKGGEAFDVVAKEISEDGNKAQGGVIGMRPADRLPDVFVEVARNLKPGEIAPELVRSGAGFHVLKLVERKDGGAFTVQQTHARHILLRVSAQLTAEAARQRLAEFKRQIQSGTKTFEQLARELRRRQRGAGRRPRLGLARHLRARVRGGDERAGDQRHLRAARRRASACT